MAAQPKVEGCSQNTLQKCWAANPKTWIDAPSSSSRSGNRSILTKERKLCVEREEPQCRAIIDSICHRTCSTKTRRVLHPVALFMCRQSPARAPGKRIHLKQTGMSKMITFYSLGSCLI